MATETGEPVELFLSSGSFADVGGVTVFPFDLPEGSTVYNEVQAQKAITHAVRAL